MKKHKLIDEVQTVLTDEARKDKLLNPVDKNILAILQTIADYKVPVHKKEGYFPISLKHNDKLKGRSLEETLSDYGVPVDYTTITRSVNKLVRLKYIDYKRGFWNNETSSGQLPYVKILFGTIPNYIEDSSCITPLESVSCGDIATPIYRADGGQKDGINLSDYTTVGYSDIATPIYKDQDKKNNNKKKNMTHEEMVAWVDGELDGMCRCETYTVSRQHVDTVLKARRENFTPDELKYFQDEFDWIEVETTFGMNDVERKKRSR